MAVQQVTAVCVARMLLWGYLTVGRSAAAAAVVADG